MRLMHSPCLVELVCVRVDGTGTGHSESVPGKDRAEGRHQSVSMSPSQGQEHSNTFQTLLRLCYVSTSDPSMEAFGNTCSERQTGVHELQPEYVPCSAIKQAPGTHDRGHEEEVNLRASTVCY
ncbi:hypothetical protein WMY93_017487 [Mugilogobius chulae]|uniref:Uncharacterized protein n=1 Tax=Mugilogobius chulae TaxID=88201 RepID=A0AAW0NT42_9GOBI